MIKFDNSWWGIKDSGDDITKQILAIVNNAKGFVVVAGYNFTFRTSVGARPFFDALLQKLKSGVPVLMVFPPRLHGAYNPQPAIINFCLSNGIAVILNHQNHSKWMLTESQMYYGSSNYTNASWRDRVEVISLHDQANITAPWAKETTRDFYSFLRREIATLTGKGRGMMSYGGLTNLTTTTWRRINTLILRLNPSFDKVKKTLDNYDKIQNLLNQSVIDWFEYYDSESFDTVFRLCAAISNAIDNLCEYAYANIYNESTSYDNLDLPKETVDTYNVLYELAVDTIGSSISALSELESGVQIQSRPFQVNLARLLDLDRLLVEYLGPYIN
jgi:hypothetical protein